MQDQIIETIGPFTGVNTKTPSRDLPAGKSVAEANLESYISDGAWLPVAGRSFIFGNSTPGGSSFQMPIVGIGKFPTPTAATNYVIATGPGATSSNGAQLAIWNGTSLTNLSFGSLASPIGLQNNVRMVQYQNFMFMSGLQTGLSGVPVPLVKIDTTNTITEWQLPAPTQAANVGFYFILNLSGSANTSTTIYGNVTSNSPYEGSQSGENIWNISVTNGQTAATIAANIISYVNSTTSNSGWKATSSGPTGIILQGPAGDATSSLPPLGNVLNNFVGATSCGLCITNGAGLTYTITTPQTLQGSYYYCYTYQNAAGTQESSPSPVAPSTLNVGFTPVSGPVTYGTITFPSANVGSAPTTQTMAGGAYVVGTGDPSVSTINLYRLGGTIGQWTFVTSVPNPGAGNSVFIPDTTPDQNLTGQSLVLHRDPPAPFNDIFVHKDRMWGFGENQLPNGQGNLWYSNYKEPWSWDNVNQVIPVGQAVAGDTAVAGCSLGSIALLLKQKSGWILYGDSPVDFLVRPAFQNIGCGAQFSLVVGEGIAYWMSADARVYTFDGNNLNYISGDIQSTFSALTSAQIAAAQGAYYEQKYYISIPALGATYYYDTIHKEWHILTTTSSCFEYDPPAREILAANPSSWEVDSWFTGTDAGVTGGHFSPSWTSRIFGDPWDSIKQIKYLQISANATGVSYPVTFTLTRNPAQPSLTPYPKSYSVTLDLINGNQTVSLPATMTGREFQLRIAGPSNATNALTPTIEKVFLRGWVKRKVKPQDE